MIKTAEAEANQDAYGDEIDMRALWAAVRRKKAWILIPTLAALLVGAAFVTVVKPRYTAEAQVLLENQENFFTRPERTEMGRDSSTGPDAENVASQVQLVTSRDLGRRAITALHLVGNSEFDPLANGLGPLGRVLVLFGLMRDPTRTPPEDRVLEAYLDRLTVFSPPKTRVLTVQFRSTDPELAAHAANVIAALYLDMQSEAKRDAAKAAAASLATEISDLRAKVARAEADAEQFRANTGLLAGTNNMSITGQQFVELNTELSKARTTQADAQAKASLIRDMIKQGRVGDVPDVANNDLVRRIAEQRVTARSQLSLEARTLLPGHPRIKELTAQIAGLDAELRAAAEKTARALENDAWIASTRVSNLETAIAQQKKSVTVANTDDVRLRELLSIVQGYRDQLLSSTTKYQEASARENSPATPADARIFARATVPQEPTYPKKLPTLIFAGIAGFVLSLGGVVASELLSGRNRKSDSRESDKIPNAPRAALKPSVMQRLEAFGRAARNPSAIASVDGAAEQDAPAAPVLQKDVPVAPLREAVLPAGPVFEPMSEEHLAAEPITQKTQTAEKEAIEAKDESPASPSSWTPPRNAEKGVRIIATSLADDSTATARLVAFARELAREGRPIIVDLDAHSTRLSALVGSRPRASLGLTDLVNGQASFAEIIHRDHASRLHFVSFGMMPIGEPAELDLILDALSQTYEFLIIAAPALATSGLAKELAAHADLVALAAPTVRVEAALEATSDELYAAGAVEVIVLDGKLESEALMVHGAA
jgi:succinoglycan biosynthesis transport protein ExoP